MKPSLPALIFLPTFALLSACGGGGDSPAPTVSVPVTTPVTTPPVAPPPPPPAGALTSCDGLDLLDLTGATADSSSEASFGPENVIDDDLSAASRWETQTLGSAITLDLGGPRLIQELGLSWFLGDERVTSFSVSVSDDGTTFTEILPLTDSSGDTLVFERVDVPDTAANFVRITTNGNSVTTGAGLMEAAMFGCSLDPEPAPALTVAPFDAAALFGLDPAAPPGENFNLLTWSIDTPRDEDPVNGRADRTSEVRLDAGFVDDDFFFTAPDGGMVFRSTIDGAPTSLNTNFNRSELREQLRLGDTSISTVGVTENNWVLGYQPVPDATVGGRNGVLRSTLAINKLTTSGTTQHEGRTIIGQIHADNDEPLRLYFKKFADSERGYIYMAHEIRDSDDLWLVVVGPENPDIDDEPIFAGADPANGIALDELFSYEIIQAGARIDVIVRRGDQDGEIIGHNYIDMIERNSGYDRSDEWMYFRAGAYTQNNTGDLTDGDQITFYRVENTHDEDTSGG